MEPEDRSLPEDPQPDPEDQARRFAREWDEIVAELTAGPDAMRSTTDAGGPDGQLDAQSGTPDSGSPRSGLPGSGLPGSGLPGSGAREFATRESGAPDSATPDAATPDSATDEGLARLFQPLRREVPESEASDEGHFVPPPPPDLPEGTPLQRLAWAGTLGGPAILLGAALIGFDLPRSVYIAAGIAALAGFATLIWLLPDSREDGWDDGAQV